MTTQTELERLEAAWAEAWAAAASAEAAWAAGAARKEAQAAEREACARLCEEHKALRLAEMIRAGGKP